MTDLLHSTTISPSSATELSADDVAEFQGLLERETGIRLDTSVAWRRAAGLISLVRMLLGPIPEDPEAVFGANGEVQRHAHLAEGPVDR